MLSSLSHVALLVPSVERSASYLDTLGIECGSPEEFKSEGTKELYVGSYEQQSGLLLLLEAISNGPYQRAMDKRGPSLHHIAIDVFSLNEFLTNAQSCGWKLHPVTQQTLKDCNTAWLYLEGIPTLIEVHQEDLSQKPLKISKIEFSIPKNRAPLFEALDLGHLVFDSDEGIYITVDGLRLPFNKIAGIK